MQKEHTIGVILANFQAALEQNGESLEEYIRRTYIDKWVGDALFHVMAVRTTFVNAMHNFLTDYGLFNMERVALSPLTDPLAHDIEYSPSIPYKGIPYMTTHSMIYSKLMACFHPQIKGIFVDSPNIRLELESADGSQRGKYLIDFSQMDIEVRREKQISLEEYLKDTDKVEKILQEDKDRALGFFEDMVITSMNAVADKNADSLKALGVRLEEPRKPFPVFRKDEAVGRHGAGDYERALGRELAGSGTPSQFFWVTGLMRENYDLIYPYLKADGTRRALNEFTSDEIYNYDLCMQSLQADGSYGTAYEVLSGGVREWLYEPIVQRLLDNKIIRVRPEIDGGRILNIEELDGYGPFLLAAFLTNKQGQNYFPSTFGGGIGIERSLFALLKGEKIEKADDVTFFGKNPDSHPVYVY